MSQKEPLTTETRAVGRIRQVPFKSKLSCLSGWFRMCMHNRRALEVNKLRRGAISRRTEHVLPACFGKPPGAGKAPHQSCPG